jgi:uncharacterized protein YdhG (YjbR/CyaY superfamily)
MSETLLPKLPGPAARALVDAGITDLHGLSRHTEAQVAALHGTGPKAMDTLREALIGEGLEFRSPDAAHLVDDYLADLRTPHRQTLEALRATLRIIVPHADEGLDRGVPAMFLDGAGVAGYAAAADHCVYFPMSSGVLAAVGSSIERYGRSAGGIVFAADKGLPGTLVAKLVRLRLDELSTVLDGIRRDYYPDGRLKAIGTMQQGQLHGDWRWYRSDGSLMRVGRFDRGVQVGTWETWDRDGTLVKRSRY